MNGLQINTPPTEQVQATMRRMEQHEWWLWSNAILVTILLLMAVASFVVPALLSGVDSFYSFFLDQAVRGLTGLVLLFNVYVVYQQMQINRMRRQLTDQVLAVGKVENLAQEVYKVAVLDPLTGLFNRRYLESRLTEEIARATRHGSPLTLILLDLDDFKQANDKYGHAAGDGVLQAFGERLRKATRGSDVAGRYGGDEFIVLLPDCRPDDVQHILKRLDGFHVALGEEDHPIRYSAGWADYVPGESAEEFLKRADTALYDNKRRGDQAAPAMSRQN